MVDDRASGGSGAELGSTDRDPPDRPSAPYLLIVAADGTWTKRSLPASGAFTIGRAAGADIRVDDRAVSHLHARLEVIGPGELRLIDLGSTNGTSVGDRRVGAAGVKVRPDQLMWIGRTSLVWHVPPAAEGSRAQLSAALALARGTQPPLSPGLAMAAVEALVAKAAPTRFSVLLLGETGVGKGVVARQIHELSTRAGGAFEQLNCAGLSAALLESELFGHEKGAFTGAEQTTRGLLEAAAGGTVFLDEIGEMPMEVQAKLLLAIEQRVVRRVGASQSRPIDVRFICATHRDLRAEIERGRFRKDFYYRINGLSIYIPPLRERRDEIDGLIARFASETAQHMGRDRAPAFDDAARAELHRHDWPGNIRELRSVIERAVVFAEGDTVTSRVLAAGLAGEALPAAGGSTGDAERERASAALAACGGNQTRAAEMLGISRNTLRAWCRRYGLPLPRGQEDPE